MIVYTPVPDFFSLRCSVCGAKKEHLDAKDDVIIAEDWNTARGTWFCVNGHANRL